VGRGYGRKKKQNDQSEGKGLKQNTSGTVTPRKRVEPYVQLRKEGRGGGGIKRHGRKKR